MAAIITDDFRRNQARLLVNDIKASASTSFSNDETTWPYRGNNRYSIGLGKTDSWPDNAGAIDEDNSSFVVPAPVGSIQEVHDVANNLFTLKDVGAAGVEQLIAKNPWTSGRKYKVYDQTDNDMFYASGDVYPCVVTYSNNVYLCLSNTAVSGGFSSVSGSTTAPSTTNYGVSTPDAQGYVWAHVATIDANDPLATNQFVPINQSPTVTDSEKKVTGGLLTHIGVVNGGSGYSSSTVATIELVAHNGTEISNSAITVTPIVSGGVITRIDIRDTSTNPTDAGSYEYWANEAAGFTNVTVTSRIKSATVTITDTGGGSGAVAYASIAPVSGFAANAIDILPTWFVGINVDFEGLDTDDDAPALTFRQVSLLKNFERNDDGDSDAGILDALKYVTLTSPDTAAIAALSTGDVLYCKDNNSPPNITAKFYFDYYDSSTGNLYYHQNSNDAVNMIDPTTADEIGTTELGTQITDGTTITSVHVGEYRNFNSPPGDKRNGEVIFHENRKPFSRSSSQTEEVKLIIQL